MKIGEKIWRSGDKLTITSDVYTMYGGEWVDAVNEAGKTITIASDKQRAENANRNQGEWKEQQKQFSNLKG